MSEASAVRSALAAVLLLSAAAAGRAGDERWIVFGRAASDRFGAAVAPVGDVDQDGRLDVIAGAPAADLQGAADAGAASVLSGLDGSELFAVTGDVGGDALGRAVAGIGDADGDGFPDFAAGAPSGAFFQGYARAYSGKDGLPLFTWIGGTGAAQAGFSLAGPGDLDGDGRADLLVGEVFEGSAFVEGGRVVALSGATGQPLFVWQGTKDHAWLGWSVAGVGDVDLDGVVDVVFGAPGYSFGASATGAAFLHSGASGALLHVEYGKAAFDGLGWSVTGTGDVDQDGVPDWAAGAPFVTTTAAEGGEVRVVSGALATVLSVASGRSHFAHFGWSAAGLGDLEGDGSIELLIGAPDDALAGLPFGRAHLVGAATGAAEAVLAGDLSPIADFGEAVALAGDTDLDGVADLLVGAPSETDPTGSTAKVGSVRLYPGACLRIARLGGAGAGAPDLFVSHGLPKLGSVAFALGLAGGPAQAAGLLLLGVPGAGPAGPFGSIAVDLAAPHLALPFALDAAGEALVALPVPSSAPAGALVAAQALVAGGSPAGFVATDGLSFRLCP